MLSLIGALVTLCMVFGGYMAAGGKIEVVLHALPFELAIILGAACGSYLISNDWALIKRSPRDLFKALKGAKWQKQDYSDLLQLLFLLIKLSRNSPIAIEEHIENPQESDYFRRYPKIARDKYALDLICDTFRAAGMNYDDAHQVSDILERRSEARKADALATAEALQAMAESLPALGIVAAVLGVIKTMSSIDQPPEILGAMIGGALVGTFLGVFLSYGFIGPMAARLRSIIEQEDRFYLLIQSVLVANVQRHPATICIEVGRQNAPEHMRPPFQELELVLRETQ